MPGEQQEAHRQSFTSTNAASLALVACDNLYTLAAGISKAGKVINLNTGILSSCGEIEELQGADVRELDNARMGTQTYDITHYQPVAVRGPQHGPPVRHPRQLLHRLRRRDARPTRRRRGCLSRLHPSGVAAEPPSGHGHDGQQHGSTGSG